MMLTRTSFPSNSSRIRLVKSRPFNARLYAHKYGSNFDGDQNQPDRGSVLFFSEDGIHRIPMSPLYDSASVHLQALEARCLRDLGQLPGVDQVPVAIASLFDITVRNARDPTRFVVVKGFCRSASLVHEVVREVTVFRGGEVLQVEQSLRPQSLSEQLRMKVALPRAFGVPPEVDALLQALSSAGGVVDSQNLGWVFTRN